MTNHGSDQEPKKGKKKSSLKTKTKGRSRGHTTAGGHGDPDDSDHDGDSSGGESDDSHRKCRDRDKEPRDYESEDEYDENKQRVSRGSDTSFHTVQEFRNWQTKSIASLLYKLNKTAEQVKLFTFSLTRGSIESRKRLLPGKGLIVMVCETRRRTGTIQSRIPLRVSQPWWRNLHSARVTVLPPHSVWAFT